MLKIAEMLDRWYQPADPYKCEFADFDMLLWGRRQRFIGFILDGDLIALDYKAMSSFRVRAANVFTLPYSLTLMKSRKAVYAKDYIVKYLQANGDNPYGVWNILRSMPQAAESEGLELTQLPPMTERKSAEEKQAAVAQMHERAALGDVIFTYDRSSGLARLIRDSDKGMWSHVAIVAENKQLCEATTSGIVKSDFVRLAEPSLDVALYRTQKPGTTEQDRILSDYLERSVGAMRYDWYAVVRIFLHQRFHVPYKRNRSRAGE